MTWIVLSLTFCAFAIWFLFKRRRALRWKSFLNAAATAEMRGDLAEAERNIRAADDMAR